MAISPKDPVRQEVIRQCQNLERLIKEKNSEIESLESQLRTRQALLGKVRERVFSESSDRNDIQMARRQMANLERDIREMEARRQKSIEKRRELINHYKLLGCG